LAESKASKPVSRQNLTLLRLRFQSGAPHAACSTSELAEDGPILARWIRHARSLRYRSVMRYGAGHVYLSSASHRSGFSTPVFFTIEFHRSATLELCSTTRAVSTPAINHAQPAGPHHTLALSINGGRQTRSASFLAGPRPARAGWLHPEARVAQHRSLIPVVCSFESFRRELGRCLTSDIHPLPVGAMPGKHPVHFDGGVTEKSFRPLSSSAPMVSETGTEISVSAGILGMKAANRIRAIVFRGPPASRTGMCHEDPAPSSPRGLCILGREFVTRRCSSQRSLRILLPGVNPSSCALFSFILASLSARAFGCQGVGALVHPEIEGLRHLFIS